VVAWPASSIRTGSPDSGWWGTQGALALRQAARPPNLSRDSAGSERIDRGCARFCANLEACGKSRSAPLRVNDLQPDGAGFRPARSFCDNGTGPPSSGSESAAIPAATGSVVPFLERPLANQRGLRPELKQPEMEAPAGPGSLLINAENFLSQDSLTHFYQRLRDFKMLLTTFRTGGEEILSQHLQGLSAGSPQRRCRSFEAGTSRDGLGHPGSESDAS
jgi:hypothetical protein